MQDNEKLVERLSLLLEAAEREDRLGDATAFKEAKAAIEAQAREIAELREKADRNAAHYEEVWIARNQILRAERDQARAEVERLKVALGEIEGLDGEINPSNYDHDGACYLNHQFCYAGNIAHAALKGDQSKVDSKTISSPDMSGDYAGDVWFGHPEKRSLATHRWDGSRWVELPSELDACLELLADCRTGRDTLRTQLTETQARLAEAVGLMQRISYDYQTSDSHHPDHVLINRTDFEGLMAFLSKQEGA